MIAADVMIPCLSSLPNCRLDWAALSAIGGWASAIATFLAVYVPARNYRADNERRANRDRQVSFVEINRIIPKVVDVRNQARSMRARVIPEIPKILSNGKSSSADVAALLALKGQVPFVILSDGLEPISMGISNLQSSMDAIGEYLADAAKIKMSEKHSFHRLETFESAMENVEVAANNLLRAIKVYAGINIPGEK